METRGAGPEGLCGFDKTMTRDLIQGGVYTELEVNEAQRWTDHLPWSHVEGGAGLRGYGVRILRIEAYSAGKKRETRNSDWSPVV